MQEIALSRIPLLLILSAFCTYTATMHQAAMVSQIADAKKQPIWCGGCQDEGVEASRHGQWVHVR
jgi:hypothetical protein